MNFNDVLTRELVRAWLSRWRLLLAMEVVCLVIGIVTYLLLPREYLVTATVIGTRYSGDVTPSSSTATFTASALLGRSVNNLPAITDFNLFTQFLTSRELGATLVNDPVLADIFPIVREGGEWQPKPSLAREITSVFRPAWHPPDAFAIASRLDHILKVAPDKDTQMLEITYTGPKPEVGIRLIGLVARRADDMVKHMAQLRLQQKVSFLQNQIAETSQTDTRMVLAGTLAKAQTDRLYSLSSLPFAAEMLAQPAAAREPVGPNLVTILLAFLFVGFLLYLSQIFYVVRIRGLHSQHAYGERRVVGV